MSKAINFMEGFNQKLNEFKVPLGLFLLGGVLLVGGLFSSNLISPKETVKDFPKESMVSEADLAGVKIDVAGAVNSPGVFTLSKEARIEDAIKMAGGFNPNVNKEYVSQKLNLSQKVTDGLKVYIPFEGDPTLQGFAGQASTGSVAGIASSGTGKVGINSADQAALETLPGVGPATAKKIIENRPFGSIEELISKKAVSKSVYSKILEMVDLN